MGSARSTRPALLITLTDSPKASTSFTQFGLLKVTRYATSPSRANTTPTTFPTTLILFLTAITPVLTKFLDSSNPHTHLFSAHTAVNKDLFPRLSGSLNVSMIADIISLTHTEGAEEETIFKRPIYAGNAILEIKTSKDKDRVRVVTVRTTAFDKATLGEGNGAEVVKVEAVGSSSKWRFRAFVWFLFA